MKVLFAVAIVCAVLWTGLVILANMMKPAETGDFIGASPLIVVWLIVGVLGIAAAVS